MDRHNAETEKQETCIAFIILLTLSSVILLGILVAWNVGDPVLMILIGVSCVVFYLMVGLIGPPKDSTGYWFCECCKTRVTGEGKNKRCQCKTSPCPWAWREHQRQ